jgi:Na+/citrate or Na+/malate symporter
MVLIVAALNASGLCSPEIKAGAKRLSDFFSKQLLWVLMVGVGVATPTCRKSSTLTFANVVIAAVIVVGAVVGAAVGGWMIGFFPIESAITAGCVWRTAAVPATWKCSLPVTV